MGDWDAKLAAAIAGHRQGRIAEAEAVYRSVLAAEPEHAEARHMMGIVHLQQGRPADAEAEIRHAIRVKPDEAKYFNSLGNALMALGRTDEALEAFDAALRRDPAFPGAAYNRATVLLGLGRLRAAEQAFRTLHGQGARDAALFVNLATCLIKQNRIPEALDCCREGAAAAPGNAILLATRASACELANDLGGAEAAVREALALQPDLPQARLILARVLRRRKRSEEALAVLEPVLAHLKGGDDHVEALYEQGLILDTLGRAEGAFAAFRESNALMAARPAGRATDPDRYRDRLRRLRRWATGERLAALAAEAPAAAGPAPVFFVGFPRSGTTLMEQVLKAHPGVVTTEERSPLPVVMQMAEKLGERWGLGYPECLSSLGAAEKAKLAEVFWAEAERMVGEPLDGRILVDKLPLNIVDLPLATAILPDAKALVALRDPRDACLSCFIQKFVPNDAMANFFDIGRTAETYAEVMGLWLHYRDILPLPWMEYRYEDLVADFDATVRKVLDFTGAGWDDEVARYREKAEARTIATPSYRDVTSAVYSRSVARWRAYAKDLAPVLPQLEPFVAAFGYGITES